MRPYTRPLAALFAVAYLSAIWLGEALHSHAGHVEPSAEATSHCAHGHCGHHHHGENDANKSDDAPGDPCDDHDCVVCQHLAKPPLVVEPVRLPMCFEPVALVAKTSTPTVPSVLAPAWWSRGPPTA